VKTVTRCLRKWDANSFPESKTVNLADITGQAFPNRNQRKPDKFTGHVNGEVFAWRDANLATQ
jgi:hypothetical protein